MTIDLTDELPFTSYWGEWDSTNGLEGSWGVKQATCVFKICHDNCVGPKVPWWVGGMLRDAFLTYLLGNPQILDLGTGASSLSEAVRDILDCAIDCRFNPEKYCCDSSEPPRRRCIKRYYFRDLEPRLPHSIAVSEECNPVTGEWDEQRRIDCGTGSKVGCRNGVCIKKEELCWVWNEDAGHYSLIDKPPGASCAIPEIITAHDPNIKYGPAGPVSAGQTLSYKVEYDNEGEGIAFGVYFTDTLDEDLDDATLELGPVKDVTDDTVIGPEGTYHADSRTVTWFAGGVGPGEGGYAEMSIDLRSDAPRGTEVINYGTVYFPSVPEETRTNAVISLIPLEICDDGVDNDQDVLIDCEDPDCFSAECQEVCDDLVDNDRDDFADCTDTDCEPCREVCTNGLDDNRNDLVDCEDPACAEAPACTSAGSTGGCSCAVFEPSAVNPLLRHLATGWIYLSPTVLFIAFQRRRLRRKSRR